MGRLFKAIAVADPKLVPLHSDFDQLNLLGSK
jgi:hypothetical protein